MENRVNEIIQQYPNLSESARKAILVFTKEEFDSIRACYLEETNEFIGLGFIENDYYTKWGDAKRYNALKVLENEFIGELAQAEYKWRMI